MVEENISQDLKLKNIDQKINYFVEEIEQYESMFKKHKEVCTSFNYIEHFLFILDSTVTECISIFASASLVGIPIGIISSVIGLKTCSITAGIKKV